MAFTWYRLQMARRPILTSSISTGFLFAAGDVIAQQAVEHRGLKAHDYKRTTRMTIYGGFLFGPAVTMWYNFLARLTFPSRLLPSTLSAAASKSAIPVTAMRVFLDQTIFTPVHLTAFLGSMAYMEHVMDDRSDPKSGVISQAASSFTPTSTSPSAPTSPSVTSTILERWHDSFWQCYKANLLLWPAVQVLNFTLVPLQWRVMVVNCVALGWNSFLSWLNNAAAELESRKCQTSDEVQQGRKDTVEDCASEKMRE